LAGVGIIMKRSILIFLFVVFSPLFLLAQQISGVVTERGTDKFVSPANVVLLPGNYGTVTGSDGQFAFKDIPEGRYKLTVSMVGFVVKTVSVNVKKNRPVQLKISVVRDNKKIEEVRILGNRQQKKMLKNPLLEPFSIEPVVSKVSEIEIEKQGAVTLIDALKYVPGGLTETRGRKVKQLFSVRGQKYPYPTYSINGIWQKEFEEMPYFFNSSNIEEVKIIRSSSALLKSLSALTGVIDITTKQPQKKEGNLFLKYGSLNSYQAGVSFGNSTKKLKYRAAVNGSGTSGQEGRNGKENIWNANAFAAYKINPELDFSVNVFYLGGMRQLVQPVEPAAAKFKNAKEVYDPIKTLLVSSKLNYKPNAVFSSELQLNYANRDLKYHLENLLNGKITEYNETDYEITVNEINTVAIGEKNTLRFGALYNYWQSPNGKRFYYGKKGEIHTVSGVVTDQHNFGKVVVDGGFRLTGEYYVEWGGFSIEGSGGKFTKVDPIVDEWQSPVWQSTGGATYLFSKSASLHFAVAGGIVRPRKGALTDDGETPENEMRFNYDIGFVKDFANAGKFTVTTFWVNRKDAIEYSGKTIENEAGEVMELYQNTDKRNYGVEAEFKSVPLLNSVTFFTNFTLMKGVADNKGSWQNDDEMPNIIANAGSNYFVGRFDLNAFLNYTGAYKNDRFVDKKYILKNGKIPLGDFVNFDINAGYRFGKEKNMRVYIEAKNLFDIKFQTVPCYPDNGRMISAGVNWKI
jgi:outer membrane cobalamin receptor